MTKTIDLGSGREITLSNELSWMIEYRSQFGQDILPVLMPLILSLSQGISAVVEEAGGMDKITEETFFRVLGAESFVDVALKLSAFEIVDILYITWAMAKAYDSDIPEPNTWIKGLGGDNHEEVPLVDVLIPAVADLIIKGVVSSKNSKRLTESIETIKGSLQPKKTQKKTTKK